MSSWIERSEVSMSEQAYDVIVAHYPNEEEAGAALAALRAVAASEGFDIVDAAVVGRDPSGEIVIDHPHTSVKRGAGVGAIIGAALGAIFPPGILGAAIVGAAVGGGTAKLADDDERRERLESLAGTFGVGTAGIVVAVEPDRGAVVRRELGDRVIATHRVIT
jgi:uncharacterized membrane protein